MAQIRVGKPDVAPDTPSHVKRVEEGNEEKRGLLRQIGHYPDGTVDARRSTGIRPRKRDPILPVMPNLPP